MQFKYKKLIKETFLTGLSSKLRRKKNTYFRKAAMFSSKESEGFSKFIDLEHT